MIDPKTVREELERLGDKNARECSIEINGCMVVNQVVAVGLQVCNTNEKEERDAKHRCGDGDIVRAADHRLTASRAQLALIAKLLGIKEEGA